mgnify:CR=1 FL=1
MDAKIVFNEQQLNNLKIFLQRTSLNGNEVPAYIEILNLLNDVEDVEDVEDGV